MAPEYSRPAAPIPADWPAGAAYGESREGNALSGQSALAWQDFFTDSRLREVVAMALNHNRDLRLAALNVERARAMYGIQRAELLPSVGSTGSMSKSRVPADLSAARSAATVERYDVNLGLVAWEIDFFGRIRSLKDRALGEYLATQQAYRSAQTLLMASTAQAYFALAADQENLGTAKATVEAQETAYRLIRRQRDLGIASELDLKRAEGQVEAVRVEAARWTQVTAQDVNALTLLAGSPLMPALLPSELGSVVHPREVSAGWSSEILLRRPDVLAAEHRLKAAHANIGAARATFFPRISLTAALGTASAELSGLFRGGSETWSFAPQIVLPVFDARTWSAYKVTQAEREMALAQYERAIQSAFREVADALAVRGTLAAQIQAQQALVAAAQETHRLARIRHERGLDGYLTVLDAQRTLYGAQQALTALRLAEVVSRVTLFKALGGGA